MRTYRRMATVAVLGALAAAALSSCGLQPDKAASVGSTTISEKQVDQVVASIPEQFRGQIGRDQIVQDMVISTACKQWAAGHGITYDTAPAAEQLAQQGLPAGQYQQILALRSACFSAVAGKPGTEPSDDELRKVYESVKKVQPDLLGTWEQAKPKLLQEPAVVNAFAAQHVAAESDVSVNPRYRTLSVPLVNLGSEVIMQVQLGEEANPAVTDAPAPSPSSPPTGGQQQQPTS